MKNKLDVAQQRILSLEEIASLIDKISFTVVGDAGYRQDPPGYINSYTWGIHDVIDIGAEPVNMRFKVNRALRFIGIRSASLDVSARDPEIGLEDYGVEVPTGGHELGHYSGREVYPLFLKAKAKEDQLMNQFAQKHRENQDVRHAREYARVKETLEKTLGR